MKELDKDEAKRAARKAARQDNGPLLEETDALAGAGEPPEARSMTQTPMRMKTKRDDDRPDLLLRESARIVGDMIELGSDEPALARQFSLLGKVETPKSLN